MVKIIFLLLHVHMTQFTSIAHLFRPKMHVNDIALNMAVPAKRFSTAKSEKMITQPNLIFNRK